MDKVQTQTVAPPSLIPAFTNGFNAVASHIYLIILPIALDLVLWFGPHLRLKELLLPFVNNTIQMVRETSTPQAIQMLSGVEEVWKTFLEHYNLLSSLSTFPLGIPSLMSGEAPLQTPMGGSSIIEVSSPWLLPLGWLAFTIIGFLLGSLYYAFIARACQFSGAPKNQPALNLRVLTWQIIQMLFLVVFLTAVLAVLFLPTLVLASVLVLLSPILAWIVMLGMSFITLWILIPLTFSPHGIYAFHQNAFRAAINSIRVARFFLPGTGLFLLTSVILYQGMGLLWRTPADNSWMNLIGIAGHAFISTGVIAASYCYYFDGILWVQSLRRTAEVPGESIH